MKIMKPKNPSLLALLVMVLGVSAQAHTGYSVEGGFPTGFSHPLFGWDHLAAMLAVGIWGGILGGRALWMLPVVFPLTMLAGAFFGMSGIELPAVETGIASSALILGLLVAFLVRIPLWASTALVGVFAIFHGYAHGAELPAGTDAFAYIIGFLVATVLLHVSGISIGLLMKWPQGKLAVRFVGGAVAVLGGAFLVGWL